MKIVINGIHGNLRFASAHLIPDHPSCGVIHGHSYHVDVIVEGSRSGEYGFVVDFKTVKNIMRGICSQLDHQILIPLKSPKIVFKDLKKNVHFFIGSKEYKLPLEDCCLLPIESTSAEDLAEYIAHELCHSLEVDNLSSLQVCVNEGIGQGAYYTKEIKG